MLTISRVRKARPADEEELMELCRDLWLENALFNMNDDKVRAVMHRAFQNEGAIIGVIRDDDGPIEGAIFLTISTFWYSDDHHIEEYFLYVRPKYRRSHNAKDLMNFAKRCSDALGIPLVIGVISNHMTKEKVGLYRRQFPNEAGSFFIYNTVPMANGSVVTGPMQMVASG